MSEPLRVLVLCTGNSARSQMAEALFNSLGRGRVHADSAGSHPAARVNPLAVTTIAEHGISYEAHPPRGVDGLERQRWDYVITVCDHAKESCPVFPSATRMLHWGMPDPAEVRGTDAEKRAAFEEAFLVLQRRIEQMLSSELT